MDCHNDRYRCHRQTLCPHHRHACRPKVPAKVKRIRQSVASKAPPPTMAQPTKTAKTKRAACSGFCRKRNAPVNRHRRRRPHKNGRIHFFHLRAASASHWQHFFFSLFKISYTLFNLYFFLLQKNGKKNISKSHLLIYCLWRMECIILTPFSRRPNVCICTLKI